jgi:DNA (cytosine-5)-methyltransferase 1
MNKELIHIGLFEGIGGFSLAAKWMGWKTVAWCEWNGFGQRTLKYYFPKAEGHGDITKTSFIKYANTIDILTGGFPCQPFSVAGNRQGTSEDRYLWPEMLRAIREIKPTAIIGENVAGILSMGEREMFAKVESRNVVRYLDFDHYEAVYVRQEKMLVNSICEQLEEIGYKVQTFVIPAASVGAPHKRERIWFVAYDSNARVESLQSGRENRIHEFGFTANTHNNGSNGSENRQGNIKGNDNYETRAKSIEQSEGCSCEATGKVATDSTSQQGQRLQPEQREFSEQEQGQFRRNGCEMGNGNVAYSGCCERENGIHGKEQGRKTAEFGNSYTKFGAWSQFPITQPTIRSGNDGFPCELDGITFPNWRNESIKAFGNAIVPQVAFEFYKAIDQYF